MVSVTESNGLWALALLQPEPPQITTNAVSFVVSTGLVLIIIIIALYFVFKNLRKKRDYSVSAELREEFERSKEALLLAAQQRKAVAKAGSEQQRESEKEIKEIELLRENVDASSVFGQACPLSGLEMMEDQELVIDPFTGQGYHFSSFLNDWPKGRDRPKYVYRHPQGTVMKSAELIKKF
jgi:hypothetical protein